MQQDNQLLFVVETTAVGAALCFLSARGVASATLELRVRQGLAIAEVLGPPTLGAQRAVEVGAELAALPATRAAAVVALRRLTRRDDPDARFERVEVASWSRLPGARCTALAAGCEAA